MNHKGTKNTKVLDKLLALKRRYLVERGPLYNGDVVERCRIEVKMAYRSFPAEPEVNTLLDDYQRLKQSPSCVPRAGIAFMLIMLAAPIILCVAIGFAFHTARNGPFRLGSVTQSLEVTGDVCGRWEAVADMKTGAGEGALKAVTVVSKDDVWALGPTTIHWDGTSWNPVLDSTKIRVDETAIDTNQSVVSANDIWAVENNNVIHWDGTDWEVEYSPSMMGPARYLWDVGATSSDNVWVVGEKENSQAFIVHWDGVRWVEVQGPAPMPMQRAFGVAAWSDEVWIVGEAFYDWEGVHYPMAARFVKGNCPAVP